MLVVVVEELGFPVLPDLEVEEVAEILEMMAGH
jgi:hypothetical protein